MALTADVPKRARVAGLGIIKLAQISQRPIYPVAVVTSRRIVLKNWDRSAINLPFGRVAIVASDPVLVPHDADDATLEKCRLLVQQRLDWVHTRGYEIVDGKKGATGRRIGDMSPAGQSLGDQGLDGQPIGGTLHGGPG
jgi:hypothetical protein